TEPLEAGKQRRAHGLLLLFFFLRRRSLGGRGLRRWSLSGLRRRRSARSRSCSSSLPFGLDFFLGLLGLLDHDLVHAHFRKTEGTLFFLPALFVLQYLDPLGARQDAARALERAFPA